LVLLLSMTNKLLIFALCISQSLFAQSSDTLKQKTLNSKIMSLFETTKKDTFPRIPLKPRKHAIYAQLFGDTPYLGLGYRYRIFNKKENQLESGFGIGFAPKFQRKVDQKPLNWSFSHHTQMVFYKSRLFSPIVGYSGVFYSGPFYKNKLVNYIPSPYFGFRLGESDRFSLSFLYQLYYFKAYSITYPTKELKEVYLESRQLSVLAVSLQLAF
jgi:hypothetical protein